MASGRDAVKLNDQEVQDLLAENLKVQVASNGYDGVPHLTCAAGDERTRGANVTAAAEARHHGRCVD